MNTDEPLTPEEEELLGPPVASPKPTPNRKAPRAEPKQIEVKEVQKVHLLEQFENYLKNCAVDYWQGLPPETIVNVRYLSKLFAVTEKTIRVAIDNNELPKPIKLFGRMSWTLGFIAQFFENRLRQAQGVEGDKLES